MKEREEGGKIGKEGEKKRGKEGGRKERII